jgi:hypothetical protein
VSSSRRGSGKERQAARTSKARAAEAAPKRPAKRPAKAPEAPPRAPSPPPRPRPPLPGPGSSRLTIKPGLPGAVRAQLVPSTKPRPPGQRRLSEVELDEDEVLIDGFIAVLEGDSVRITAVLERTCVYLDRNGDRRLARKKDLWVEADKLPIRRRGIG